MYSILWRLGYGLDGPGLKFRQVQEIFFSSEVQTGYRTHPASYSEGDMVFPVGNAAEA